MTKEVDLHIHSHYSDGDCSIEELIKRIKDAKLKAAVLTDHDTMDGVEKFIQLCATAGIDTTTGVEISSTHTCLAGTRSIWKTELHILGYGYNTKSLSKDKELLYQNQIIRNHHVENMMMKYRKDGKFITSFVELTKQFGIPWPLASKYWLSKSRAIYLMKKCDIEQKEATDKALTEISSGGAYHIKREDFCPSQEAVRLIIKHGGIAVWAHPMVYLNQLNHCFEKAEGAVDYSFKKTLEELKDYGLYGIEVYAERQPENIKEFLLKCCEKYDLDPNFGGSDYHGDQPNEHMPGKYLGKGGIDYDQFLGWRENQ